MCFLLSTPFWNLVITTLTKKKNRITPDYIPLERIAFLTASVNSAIFLALYNKTLISCEYVYSPSL